MEIQHQERWHHADISPYYLRTSYAVWNEYCVYWRLSVCVLVCLCGCAKTEKNNKQKLVWLAMNMSYGECWKWWNLGDIWLWHLTLRAFSYFWITIFPVTCRILWKWACLILTSDLVSWNWDSTQVLCSVGSVGCSVIFFWYWFLAMNKAVLSLSKVSSLSGQIMSEVNKLQATK